MRATTRRQSPTAEAQVRGFIAKFDPANQRLIRAVRKVVRGWFPTAYEMVWDNYNFFVIGYSPTERPSDAILSIAAAANGVGICFLHGAKLADPKKILVGGGKQVRFIRVPDAASLARPEVIDLVDAATAMAKPMPPTGRGKLVIRGISSKQRPRRHAPKGR